MDYIAILGHEPTAEVKRLIEALNAYVERKHREQPDVPVESWWGAIEAELTDLINKDRAEG